MIFQGIPWPLLLPIALLALTAGIMSSKKEMRIAEKNRSTKKKKS